MLRNSVSIVLSVSILLQGLNLHLSDMIEIQVLMKHLKEHKMSYGDDLMTFFDLEPKQWQNLSKHFRRVYRFVQINVIFEPFVRYFHFIKKFFKPQMDADFRG